MKKIIFLVLSIALNFTLLTGAVPNKTVSLTLTVGSPYTIVPYADLGIEYNYVRSCYAPSDPNTTPGTYDVSEATAFSVIPNQYTYKKDGITWKYYTYTLTPQETGFYTFQVVVSYLRNTMTGDGGQPVITYNITVVNITDIILPSTVDIPVGESYRFSPVLVPNNATTNYTWTSLNPDVATISSDGTVTAQSIGEAVITCMAHNGVTTRSTIRVNPVLVNNIEMNETSAEMVVGDNLQLVATVLPFNATNKTVTWSSTNESVAVVDESGIVTAVGSGTCQIKATATDGSGKTASCLVTVEKNNKLTLTDMAGCSGGRGTMRVVLTDEETVLGFQFDLQLPAGVTVATDDGTTLLASLTGKAATTHSIRASQVSEGLYRFIVTSMSGKAISSSDGDGMSISIDVADDVAVGTYDVTIKDIEMTIKNGSDYEDVHPRDNTAHITVTEAILGDVNGDTRISVTDVISIVGYLMENEPSRFIRKVADVNGDGNISITDAVLVIDMILDGESGAKMKREILNIVEPQ